MSVVDNAIAQQVISRMARERGLPEWQMEMILAEPAGFMQNVVQENKRSVHEPSSPIVPPTPTRPSERPRADVARRADVASYVGPGSGLDMRTPYERGVDERAGVRTPRVGGPAPRLPGTGGPDEPEVPTFGREGEVKP